MDIEMGNYSFLRKMKFITVFSDGAALVGRFVLLPFGDFSRGVGDLAAFSAARGLFVLTDRFPDCGRLGFTCCCCCCSCS